MDYAGFLTTVEREAQVSREEAERAARATLETLGERLSVGEARDVASELPGELRPALQTDTNAQPFHLDEFLRRVAEAEGVMPAEAERHARAVFAALGAAVSDDELADLASELPKDFGALLETAVSSREAARRAEHPILSADVFLSRVAERTGLDREDARRATDAVLEVLAIRISGGQVDDLAAQLPPELRRPLERGKIASQGLARPMPLADFVRAVAEREGIPPGYAHEHIRAVLATLREAVGEKEYLDMRAQLPDEYSAVLPPRRPRRGEGRPL
jgi:uncharacterized protein (DUF2267 family)